MSQGLYRKPQAFKFNLEFEQSTVELPEGEFTVLKAGEIQVMARNDFTAVILLFEKLADETRKLRAEAK